LSRLDYSGKNKQLVLPDPEICFQFSNQCLADNRLAK
jgi:hypothetical protein